jgi:3-hydroxyacyl-CoA dehydrogenase
MKVVDAIEAAASMAFEDGCRRERELFFECVQNDQAKGLIHVFFAERAAGKPPTAVAPRPVDLVAIVGAGTMGGGIAMACANAGLRVVLKDTSHDAIDAGLAAVRRNYAASVARGSLTDDLVQARLARIETAVDSSRFGEADLIVEAVYENLELKKSVFRELDAVARPGCVLATNTSTLDIDAIANATSRPASVVGLHFFSPAHVMRLVEVVRGRATSDETIATAFSIAKRLGKAPVLAGNCRGFVGNRMMFPYMYEAQFLVEEGATPEQVDHALTDFGMAMGIFAVDDMAGIDVAVRVRRELGHFSEPNVRQPLVQEQLVDRGRLGQKTGKGWYRYDDRRKASPDQDVVALIRQTASEAGIPQRAFTQEAIVERTIYALINEGARIIDEGYASRAADVDVIYVNGYGFPGWRGGPLFYADRLGIRRVYDRVCDFHREFGDRWTPAPLLASPASSGGTFREHDRSL